MTKTITIYNHYIGRVIAALAAIIALSAFAYGTFLLLAVAHAAGITQAQDDARTLTAQIGALDTQYLDQTQALTQDDVTTLGFVKPTDVAVVYAPTPESLTFNR